MGLLTKEMLVKYKTNILVETGTYLGESIKVGLEAGVARIHSIELSEELYKENVERFKAFDQVTIHHGDSAAKLPEIIATLSGPATFWLDAHHCGGNTGIQLNSDTPRCPILKEIHAIAQSTFKDHTILIDDIRLFGMPEFDNISLDDVQDAISAINADYKFELEKNSTYPLPDILSAFIR